MNVSASVHQRLLNLLPTRQATFEQLLRDYVIERFLYRLSRSVHREKFILKGALLFRAWEVPAPRHTMDVDLEGRVRNDLEELTEVFRQVCALPAEPDGLAFSVPDDAAEVILEDAVYHGIRLRILAQLGRARIPLRIDVGFGAAVHPPANETSYPTLLQMPPPVILAYPKETAIAEKVHAMASLGLVNSRLKDYYDLWLMSGLFEFDGNTLCQAVAETCRCRTTFLPADLEGLTPRYAHDHQLQWESFSRRHDLDVPDLVTVLTHLSLFLGPVITAVASGAQFAERWPAGGPWTET